MFGLETQSLSGGHARDLLAEGGIGALSMRAVASRVGLSATALYHYFENKEAILVGVFDRAMDRFIGGGIQELGSGRGARSRRCRWCFLRWRQGLRLVT